MFTAHKRKVNNFLQGKIGGDYWVMNNCFKNMKNLDVQ